MTTQTRLKIGKEAYERGDKAHPHYAEYVASLGARSEDVEARSEQGKPVRKYKRQKRY